MTPYRHHTRAAISLVTAVALVLPPCSLVFSAQAPATATPAKAAKPAAAAKAAATPAPVDGGWPRAYTTPAGARLVLYQPQIASWDGQKHVVAYAAVSYEAKGADKPALGTVKVEADTNVALDERLVSFPKFKIAESQLRDGRREQVQEIVAEIDQGGSRRGARDRARPRAGQRRQEPDSPKNVEGVKADPPAIFFSTTPAVLVNLDGEPIWSPIKDNDLKFAVNTNWDLFEHEPDQDLYLRNDAAWLKATALEGPWTPAGTLPGQLQQAAAPTRTGRT